MAVVSYHARLEMFDFGAEAFFFIGEGGDFSRRILAAPDEITALLLCEQARCCILAHLLAERGRADAVVPGRTPSIPRLHPHLSYGSWGSFVSDDLMSMPLAASEALCRACSAHRNLLGH